MSLYPYSYTTTATSEDDADIIPGDIVAVNHGMGGRKEGLVIGSHVDYAGRKIIEVQLDAEEVYHAWYPSVTRVKRTISYSRPSPLKHRTVERRIMW